MNAEDGEKNKIGIWALWAIGVGSSLGGTFFGWQFVLYGGFVSSCFAVLFCGFFYWLYAGAILELASRHRSGGGAFDFVRRTLGNRPAALMAVLGLFKLVLFNASLALAISNYLEQAGIFSNRKFFSWFLIYSFFTCVDCMGMKQSSAVQIVATLLCLSILAVWACSCLTGFSVNNLRSEGWIVNGAKGLFEGLPFALQFFDGFEDIPLLHGYTRNADVTIPNGVFYSYCTVAIIAVIVLVAGSGMTDASVLLKSEAPLMEAFDTIFGDSSTISDVVAYLVVLGLLVNFFAFTLFTSQQLQAVADAGQLPAVLAYRHPDHGAPIFASICASIFGLGITSAFSFVFGEDAAQAILNMIALMPAVLGYALVLECIIQIRDVEFAHGEKKVSPRDLLSLGHAPGSLRFSYGSVGARIAQLMCFTLAGSLLIMATIDPNFMWALVSLTIGGFLLYIYMSYFIRWYVCRASAYTYHLLVRSNIYYIYRLPTPHTSLLFC